MVFRLGKEKTALICLVLLLALPALAGRARAAEQSVGITLTVSQLFDVQQARSAELEQIGAYRLTPASSDFPLPAGSVDGVYDFSIEGNESQTLSMTFAHGGVYTYTLAQLTPDDDNFIYDRTTYTVTVYVENGNGALTAQIVAGDGSGGKSASLSFRNTDEGGLVKDALRERETETETDTDAQGQTKGAASGTGAGTSTGAAGAVRTGDETPLALWGILTGLSALTAAVLGRRRTGRAGR